MSSTVTPSGGWIGGAVILGDTGIGMSVRGEQFWLDKTKGRAATATLAAAIHADAEHRVARWINRCSRSARPGGDNQEQTILQTFLNVVEFWPTGIRIYTRRFEWPRVQTLHFYAVFLATPARV